MIGRQKREFPGFPRICQTWDDYDKSVRMSRKSCRLLDGDDESGDGGITRAKDATVQHSLIVLSDKDNTNHPVFDFSPICQRLPAKNWRRLPP